MPRASKRLSNKLRFSDLGMGIGLRKPLFLTCETLHELHQTAQGDSRRALGDPRLLIFHPRCARDIEVDPWSLFGELLQEHGRIDSAAPASAGIHNIGDRGLDVLLILVVE